MVSRHFLLPFLTLLLLPSEVKAEQCSVCPNGENITLPEKAISIPGLEIINDCNDLDTWIPVLLQDNAPDCHVVRDLSTLCGCPRKENTCTLCPDGSKVANPALEVPLIFQDQFQGITPTCELFEAFLHSVDENNSTCTLAQQVLSDYCGCSSSEEQDVDVSPCLLCPSGDSIVFPNKTFDLEGFPLQNCQELEDAALIFLETGSDTCELLQSVGSFCGCPPPIEDGCTLCHDGSMALNQSKPVELLEEQFGFVPTCGLLEAALTGEQKGSEQCTSGKFFGSWCGCPPVENHCNFCDPGDAITTPDKEIPQFQRFIPFTPTCSMLETFQYQLDQDSTICKTGYTHRWRCGCNRGEYELLGADSASKRAALVWIPRVTGMISIFGSLYILYDILSQRTKKLDKTYPQLMVAMALFDIVNSVAWALSTLPIPEYDKYGDYTNIYGAKGNEATCTAQGFFIQLGYTGIFFNVSLSIYYYLVIVMSWKESRLKKIRKFLHLVPLMFGLSLAFAGIPHYDIDVLACYIAPPPIVATWTNIVIIAFAPISFVILFLTCVMFVVYWKVRKNSRASNKWRKGHAKANQKRNKKSLEKEVFWQCVFYVCSFFVSWPILLAAKTNSEYRSFPFWAVVVTLIPIQGLNNCIVYVRPRLLRRLRASKKLRERAPTSTASADLHNSSVIIRVQDSVSAIFAPVVALRAKLRRARMAQQMKSESRRYVAQAFEGEYVEPEIAIAEDDEEEEGDEDVDYTSNANLDESVWTAQISRSVPGFNIIDKEAINASNRSLTLDDLVAQTEKKKMRRHSSCEEWLSRDLGVTGDDARLPGCAS